MKISSINILSSNPKHLAEFYKEALGANTDETHGGPHRIEIWFGERNDDTVYIVANYDADYKPQKSSACHGFELRVPDADAMYAQLCNLAIAVKEPPKDLPWGYRFFNICDPDGNVVDIVQKL